MTNKQAIETIKMALAEVEWNYPMEYAVAFEKAIKSLKKDRKKAKYYKRKWLKERAKKGTKSYE